MMGREWRMFVCGRGLPSVVSNLSRTRLDEPCWYFLRQSPRRNATIPAKNFLSSLCPGRVCIRDNLWWHQATNRGDCCWQHCHCSHFAGILHNIITFVLIFFISFSIYTAKICTFKSYIVHCPSPSVTKVSTSVWQVEVTLQLIKQD